MIASLSAIFLRLRRRPGPTMVDTVAANRNLPWIAPTYLGPYRSAWTQNTLLLRPRERERESNRTRQKERNKKRQKEKQRKTERMNDNNWHFTPFLMQFSPFLLPSYQLFPLHLHL